MIGLAFAPILRCSNRALAKPGCGFAAAEDEATSAIGYRLAALFLWSSAMGGLCPAGSPRASRSANLLSLDRHVLQHGVELDQKLRGTTMQNIAILKNELIEIEDEPRILDVELARHLGIIRERDIRAVIANNRDELELHGSLRVETANPGIQGGRPGSAYYLNEGQALVICALSRTPKAAQVRKQIIDVFMAWRRGKIVHVREHKRRMPVRRGGTIQFSLAENHEFVLANGDFSHWQSEFVAGLLTRVQNLEIAAFGEEKDPHFIRAAPLK